MNCFHLTIACTLRAQIAIFNKREQKLYAFAPSDFALYIIISHSLHLRSSYFHSNFHSWNILAAAAEYNFFVLIQAKSS